MTRHRANEVISQRVVTSTRKNYGCSIKKFKTWIIQKNYANALLNGEIKVPLPNEEIILEFLGEAQKIDSNGVFSETNKLIATSTMTGIYSAINNLYREKEFSLTPLTKTRIQAFLAGYKRIVSEAKLTGQLPILEGKKHLTFQNYCCLAKYALQSQTSRDGSLFSHIFMLLSWNLFARSNSVAQLSFHHFEWENDSLIVTLPKHKGDQEGANVLPKHIYANPKCPEICPILGLAIYVFSTNLFHLEGQDWRLFSGNNSETKFSHWLVDILKRNLPPLAEINVIAKDIGTHSFRKGVVTYVLSFPGGPSVVAAYLRAAWSLGAVQQRYIFEGEGADQFLGRVASGLILNGRDFTILPPRLSSSSIISLETWLSIYPNYNSVPRSFQRCLPYLIASLSFHLDWIKQNLDQNHPLFRSPVWRSNVLISLQQNILVGFGMCPVTSLAATGIPPTIALSLGLEELKERMAETTEIVTKGQLQMMNEIPGAVGNHIVSNFSINGVIPVTMQHFQDFRESLLREIRSNPTISHLPSSSGSNEVSETVSDDYYPLYYWGGKYHRIPESFTLNAMSVQNIWDVWHYGDKTKAEIIPPIRLIDPKDDLKTKDERTKFSKAKRVVTFIEDFGRSNIARIDRRPFTRLPVEERIEIFQRGFTGLIQAIEERNNATTTEITRRYGELMFTSLPNLMEGMKMNK